MINNIIVIGTGSIACNVAKLFKDKGLHVTLLESRSDVTMTSESFCLNNEIYFLKKVKGEITDYFLSINERTLVISASNRYLFPELVIQNSNLLIINYHGALLPAFPGRNAEAWAIYSGVNEAGITWHKVVKDVDAGDILIQKKVQIGAKTTSFSLLRDFSRLALDAITEKATDLILEKAEFTKQKIESNPKLYYSWERPNNSWFPFDATVEKMNLFIRSMDYGPLQTLGPVKVEWMGERYTTLKFKVSEVENKETLSEFNNELGRLTFQKEGYLFTFDQLIKIVDEK